MRCTTKHRVASARFASVFDLLLRTKAPACHGDRGFATRTIVPMLKRREKPVSWPVHVGEQDGLAFGAGHRDSVAFFEIQIVASVVDVIQGNEFAFLKNARGWFVSR